MIRHNCFASSSISATYALSELAIGLYLFLRRHSIHKNCNAARRNPLNDQLTQTRDDAYTQMTSLFCNSAVPDNAGARRGAYFVVALFSIEAVAGLLWYVNF